MVFLRAATVSLLSLSSVAWGQVAPSPAPSLSPTPVAPVAPPAASKKGRLPKKGGKPTSKETPSKVENGDLTAAPAEARPAWLWPDWSPDAFDWGVSPVLGLRLTREDAGILTQTEGGAMVQVRGVPVAEGNPGVTLAPSAGFALGYAAWTPDTGKADSGMYQRAWGGVDVPILVKFYKHTLGIHYGDLWGKVVSTTKSATLSSDSAFLVLPFLSAHYTYTRDAAFGSSLAKKISLVHDNWWHLRLFTSVLSAFLDFGPGYEIPYAFLENSTLHGSSTYFLARAGADVIPRFLSADVESRYAFQSNDNGASLAGRRRPGDDLSAAPSSLGQPSDSLVASAFLGWKNVIGGVGLGYRYSVEIQNFSEKDGETQDVRSSQGFGLHVSHAF